MARQSEAIPDEEAATLHDALGHPVRVAIVRILAAGHPRTMPDLRRATAERTGELDARTLQYHVSRLHVAGIVDLRRRGGREHVWLVRDVRLRVRPAPPPDPDGPLRPPL